MKRMLSLKGKEDLIKRVILIVLAAGSFCAVAGYILYGTRAFFHSDMASWLLLAKEQLEKKQFFPDNFCYSTGLFIITPELFVAPLMCVISDWILCREIAVILANILLIVVIFAFFRTVDGDRKAAYAPWIAVILWCIPMGHYEEGVWEGAYLTLCIFELCIMLSFYRIVCGDCRRKKLSCAALFLSVFAANVEGIRNLVVMVVPLLGAIVIYLLIENWKELDRVFQNKRYNCAAGITVLAAGCAVIAFKLLSGMVKLQSESAGVTFLSEGEIAENVRNLLTGIAGFYRAVGSGGLFSAGGITSCINFVVLVVCSVIVPVSMLVLYRKIKNPFWKIYTLYCWISNFIVLYMMAVTTAGAIRYYYTVFWHNLILTALLFGYLIEKGHKYIRTFFLASVLLVCAAGHFNFLLNTMYPIKQGYEEDQAQGTISEYLEENGLTYGFASYWNAYKNMALSDGRVKIVSWCAHPNEPYYWLTSREWYEPERNPGRCFILLAEGETIRSEYYTLASEIRHFRGYTILVYEKHIYLYDELNQMYARGEAVNEDNPAYTVPLDSLNLGENAWCANGKIGLKQNGAQYGPYLTLTEGEYRLQITGENLSSLQTEVCAGMGASGIELEEEEAADEVKIYSFDLTELQTGVEIKNSNLASEDIIITGITISK